MEHITIRFPSNLRVTLILFYILLTACSSSSDEPPPEEPTTSSTWGEKKWGEVTGGK